jgi:DeoR family glycerol-3-phosphate regulon repressor
MSGITQRETEILNLVERQGFTRIADLATEFQITEQSIRRVINPMCETGILRRVHGGVDRPVGTSNLAFSTRSEKNLPQKVQIGRAIAERIPEGSSVFLGLGTTVAEVANCLQDKTVTVITNNLVVASALFGCETVEVWMTPGKMRPFDGDVCGTDTVEYINSFNVDYAVISAGGITREGEVVDFYIEEANVSRAMLANARVKFLALDSSKWGKDALRKVADLEQFTAVFCDEPPAAGILDSAVQEQLKRVLAS